MTAHATWLADRGIVRVAGEDAATFLQGLATSDIEGLAPGIARYGALLSPQGKILFDFIALRVASASGAEFLLDCPLAAAPDFAKRLGFYRLRAKVAIADESAALSVVAFWGGSPPEDFGADAYADPRDPKLGSRAIVARARATAIGADGLGEYERLRVELGVPRGGADFTYGDAYPHDANLDRLGGVDFNKGCYVGQEVVSRMQHRGGARKRILRLTLAGDAPPPGTPVLAGETPIGALGSAVGRRALAMLRIDKLADAASAGTGLSVGGVSAEARAG